MPGIVTPRSIFFLHSNTKANPMIITIPQKPSNSGTIHDLASDLYDRQINLGNRFNYTVVLPSFFGDVSSRHKTTDAVVRKVRSLHSQGYAPVIIDRLGQQWDLDYDTLRLVIGSAFTISD